MSQLPRPRPDIAEQLARRLNQEWLTRMQNRIYALPPDYRALVALYLAELVTPAQLAAVVDRAERLVRADGECSAPG